MAGTIVDKGNGKYKLCYMYKSERYYETVSIKKQFERHRGKIISSLPRGSLKGRELSMRRVARRERHLLQR